MRYLQKQLPTVISDIKKGFGPFWYLEDFQRWLDVANYETRRLHRPRQKSASWHDWGADLAWIYFEEIDRNAGWSRNGPACRFIAAMLGRVMRTFVTPGAVEVPALLSFIRQTENCSAPPSMPCQMVYVIKCNIHSPIVQKRTARSRHTVTYSRQPDLATLNRQLCRSRSLLHDDLRADNQAMASTDERHNSHACG